MRSPTYIEAIKDVPIGKTRNFRWGIDSIRTRIWNNIFELTTTVVEIERAKFEAV